MLFISFPSKVLLQRVARNAGAVFGLHDPGNAVRVGLILRVVQEFSKLSHCTGSSIRSSTDGPGYA